MIEICVKARMCSTEMILAGLKPRGFFVQVGIYVHACVRVVWRDQRRIGVGLLQVVEMHHSLAAAAFGAA